MFYIQRDAEGRLVRVEAVPFDGMTGTMAADSAEIRGWQANHRVESSLQTLRQSDLDMVRVLEDLIHTLISKGVVMITDLPPAAQEKLMNRSQAREVLNGINQLINDNDRGLL